MIPDPTGHLSRREVLATAATALGATTVARSAGSASQPAPRPVRCLFTKPLHNRPFWELPAILADLGIDAVDLTCRKGGHVLPERVADDLPAAHGLLARAGISVPMVTTEITEAAAGNAEQIISTAASLGIRYLKLGYYEYGDLHRMRERLAQVKDAIRGVATLCGRYGLRAGFHNHAGPLVGAPMWDLAELLGDLPADTIGSYFDVRHATVEGGDAGWRLGMHLLAPRIVMVSVKDFVWQKDDRGGWRPQDVPLGQGMVRCEEAMRLLKELGFAGPISLHMEYGQSAPPVGSDADRANLDAIRADWKSLGGLLDRVGLNT
jgi:L-ribulose-5-phosphate 3-epimerase